MHEVMPDLLNDPELWRKHAAEARAIAME